MAGNHASKIVRAEMNECLQLRSAEGRANVRVWVRCVSLLNALGGER